MTERASDDQATLSVPEAVEASPGSPTPCSAEPLPAQNCPELVGILAEHVPMVWCDVVPLIASTLQDGTVPRLTPDELLRELLSRRLQLWVIWQDGILGAMITEVVQYASCSAARIIVLTETERLTWDPFIEHVGLWARSLDCELLEVLVRPEWEDRLREMRKTHALLEKRLR